MTVTKSDFDPKCFGSQYQDPPETLHFQFEGVRCDNYVYRYVLVDKFRPNKIDARSKKTEEEVDKSSKEIAAGYLPLVLSKEVKPGLFSKIKNIFFNG
tara:strand:- start:1109 stop:1402 length:294 start_codon:yes stop_codon:yes gene_type:complete